MGKRGLIIFLGLVSLGALGYWAITSDSGRDAAVVPAAQGGDRIPDPTPPAPAPARAHAAPTGDATILTRTAITTTRAATASVNDRPDTDPIRRVLEGLAGAVTVTPGDDTFVVPPTYPD